MTFTTLLTSIENIIDKLSDTLHQINIAADRQVVPPDRIRYRLVRRL